MGLKLFGKNILQVYTHKIMKIEYKTAAGNPEKSSYTLRKINNDIITEELAPIGTTVTVSNLNTFCGLMVVVAKALFSERMIPL